MARKSRDGDSSSSRYVRKREHSIFWSSRDAAAAVKLPPGLKGFFARFGNKNFRAFPWRAKNVRPFHLLLAEVLLVQTKAEDVARVWPRLIREYPTPFALARARTGHLVRLLRPLGLQNQRAKSLKVISRTLTNDFDGKVPQSLETLLSIPYLGLYTASAIDCFIFGKRVPIVDANVLRVFERITGRKAGRDLRRAGEAWRLAWALLPEKNCAMHNYGILDFSSKICTARNPNCATCSLNSTCSFGRQRAI
jgi:A/G-specific adenine glycosylase